jgi:SAM-dependent methyltransferase
VDQNRTGGSHAEGRTISHSAATYASTPLDRAQVKRLIGRRGVTKVQEVRRKLRRWRRHPTALAPASPWGWERGTPVDRYYIEAFLAAYGRNPGAIRGRVLEVGDDRYTRRFGDSSNIKRVDIIDNERENEQATIVADLSEPDALPAEAFDCIILTEVLMLVFDFRAALANLHRALRPDGVLLITVAGITRSCGRNTGVSGDYWRFTSRSLQRLLEELFGIEDVTVQTYGNVRAASAFLYGLAAEELSESELNFHDPDYEVTVAARAVKSVGE